MQRWQTALIPMPHHQAKSLARIGESFSIFTEYKFLLALHKSEGDVGRDAEALTCAMERYLAFQW